MAFNAAIDPRVLLALAGARGFLLRGWKPTPTIEYVIIEIP